SRSWPCRGPVPPTCTFPPARWSSPNGQRSAVPEGRSRRQRPTGPGLVHGVFVTLLVLFIAAVALSAKQTPPPSVAELAPQASQQIKDAPAEQSSRFGSGAG